MRGERERERMGTRQGEKEGEANPERNRGRKRILCGAGVGVLVCREGRQTQAEDK